ncbi:MAG: hypothetical protein J3R72DRAFT_464734 [Linnemannia gamsii]|nr:MAG: hypothetical protein J3R72DRAFT_464734 [Linnemannia gamsii]
MQLLTDAADPDLYAYKDPLASDDVGPSPDVLRELVGFYLQYMHPIHGLVDPQAPDFWTRLDRPLEPNIASIVYAMCTIGAVFKSSTPSSESPGVKPPTPSPGVRDDLVYGFYTRTWTLKDERPRDIVTIQTILIMQSFFDLTSQVEEASSSFRLMAEIADEIELGAHVLELGHREKLSKEDILVRNTWKLFVWNEVMGFLITKQSSKIIPTKDLSSKALDVRPEEIPGSKTSIAAVVHYHLGNLFKIFQLTARIKLPMSPRDLHAVTNILDAFTAWHGGLPKHLRGPGSRPTYASGKGTTSSSAYTLDLYFRLGHILLLNSLPSSVRSSPTGLGPRRESPLRILATCANGITATVSDLTKEPELRNYCMAHGLRCLTEAAMLQLANSKELDPNISTPAKLNFMKTLWCIRQFNFTLPHDVLNLTLAPYDNLGKTPSSSFIQDSAQMDPTKEIFHPRTPSASSVSMESPVFFGPQRTKRDISLASDYGSSTTSAREGSHPTIHETNEQNTKRVSRTGPISPLQDNAAASLLALSLESPTAIQSLARASMVYGRAPDVPLDGVESRTSQAHPPPRDDYEGDRSRSSSISVLSLRTESPKSHLANFTDIQSYPVAGQRSSLSSPAQARREPVDSHSLHVQDYRPPSDAHPHPHSPRQNRGDIYRPFSHRSTSTLPISGGAWTSPDNRYRRLRGSPVLDERNSLQAQADLPSSSTTAPTWHAEMAGPDLPGVIRPLFYERDSTPTVSDQQRPSPNFQSTPNTSGAASAGPPHNGVIITGSSRSLLASERPGTSDHYDQPHEHGASQRRTAPDHSNRPSGLHSRQNEHDQQSAREMRPPQDMRPRGNSSCSAGRDMETYRMQQQLPEYQDQPSRSHGHHRPSSRPSASRDAGEQESRSHYLIGQHADTTHSVGVTTTATITATAHSNPEYASRSSRQRTPNFHVHRRSEQPIGYQDPALLPSHLQGPRSALASIESELHLEEQTRHRQLQQLQQPQQQQQQLHHPHPYHRQSIDENVLNRSSVSTRTSTEQPSRGGDATRKGPFEHESPQTVDVSSPLWSFSPRSAAAAAAAAAVASRPIAMPSSRASSRRSSAAVLWQESPHLREALSRDRDPLGSEEPLLRQDHHRTSVSSEGRAEPIPSSSSMSVAGRKRPSVSMYSSAGDEEVVVVVAAAASIAGNGGGVATFRNRVGSAMVDLGQHYQQRASDSGQGSSRPLERRQSGSTRAIERQEQGVGLGLSVVTPPMRYAQPEFPRDHQQYSAQQGRPSERHAYPNHRSMHPPPPPPHFRQDPRYFQPQEQVYDPALSSSHYQQQRSISTHPPHPHPLGPVQSTYPQTRASIPPPPQPDWSFASEPRSLGSQIHAQTKINDSVGGGDDGGSLDAEGNDGTSGYSDVIREAVRRKYR